MRLNPLSPYLPKYPGPYQVGTAELEVALPASYRRTFGDNLPLDTCLVRLFYPISDDASKHARRRPKWLGEGGFTVRGYAQFLGIKDRYLSAVSLFGLRWTEIPAALDTPLLPKRANQAAWPCLLFSHGLGGSRNAYSQICGSLASGGLFVCAVEHRDASAAISVVRQGTPEERIVTYVPIKETNPTTVARRRAQMAQRTYEMGLGLALTRALNRGDGMFLGERIDVVRQDGMTEEVKQSITGQLNCVSGKILAAGHSFGAATAVHCCKEDGEVLLANETATPFKREFGAAVLLDPWMEVLQDTDAKPLDIPSVAVASEAFQKWSGNFSALKRLLRPTSSNGGRNKLLWIRQSAHLSQSDFQLLFPLATKYAFKAAIDPHEAMSLNVRAVREYLRELGIGQEQPDPDIWKGIDQEASVLQEEKL